MKAWLVGCAHATGGSLGEVGHEGDGPDEAAELAGDGGHGVRGGLAAAEQAAVASGEAMERPVADRVDLRRLGGQGLMDASGGLGGGRPTRLR